jgi:integrase
MRRTRVERGIYRQTNGRYGVYVVVGGKPRFKTVGPKLSEARRQRDVLSARAQRGELPRPTRMTFRELAETWIENFEALVASGERSERTLEHYRYHLDRHLLPALGTKRLQELTTDECARLIASLRSKGLAPKTIAGCLVPLGRILALALRRGLISDNPLRRLDPSERPRIHRREQRVLSHDEILKLLAHVLPAYRPLLATALYSGLRLSELLGLVWQDVDLEQGLIHVRYQLSRARVDRPARRVRLKTPAAARDIPLLPQLAALLKRHKLASPHSGDHQYVFATGLGTPLGYRNVERRGLTRAAAKAGLQQEGKRPLRLHDLRHTFASHLIIDLKLDVAHVSRILGHNRPSVTLDTYTHLFDQAAHAEDIRQRMANSQFGGLLAETAGDRLAGPAAGSPSQTTRALRPPPW